MLKKIQNFLRDEEGATAVEYGLILGIIAIVIIAGFGTGSASLRTIFSNIAGTLSTAATPAAR